VAVVAACALVTRNVAAKAIVVGNPAQVIGEAAPRPAVGG